MAGPPSLDLGNTLEYISIILGSWEKVSETAPSNDKNNPPLLSTLLISVKALFRSTCYIVISDLIISKVSFLNYSIFKISP